MPNTENKRVNRPGFWKLCVRLFTLLHLSLFLAACQPSSNPAQEPEQVTVTPPSLPAPATEYLTLPPDTTPIHVTPVEMASSTATSVFATPTVRSTPPPTAEIRPTSTPKAVPLNGRIVFSSRREDTNGDGRVDPEDGIHLYTLDLVTNELRQLTSGPYRDLQPSWSPHGDQIAFVSNREGNYELFTVDADGSNTKRLTMTPEDEESPAWSPDGAAITYVVVKTLAIDLQERRLYLITSDGMEVEQLTFGPANDYAPDWSPDAHYMVFERENIVSQDGLQRRIWSILLLDRKKGTLVELDTEGLLAREGTSIEYPKWLPREGYFLSVIQDLQPSSDVPEKGISIFQLEWVEGGLMTKQTFRIADAGGPHTWGPGGQWLISVVINSSRYPDVNGIDLFDLAVLPVDYTTQEPPYDTYLYSLSLDGKLITDNSYYDNYPDWTP